MARESFYSNIPLRIWESISLLLLPVYTASWQITFAFFFFLTLHRPASQFASSFLMFSLSQCIYHILFIISSPTLSALLLVLSPIELLYHGIVLGGPSRRLVKFSPPYSQELKGPGKGEVMKWDFFSPFFEEYGPTPFKIPSVYKSSCVHSILFSSGFSHRLFLSFLVKHS